MIRLSIRASACIALAGFLGGCAASISSAAFEPNDSAKAIVYRLPAREISVLATYELQDCSPFAARLVGLSATTRLVPSADVSDAFSIDPKMMRTMFGSVNPAKLDLSNGIISSAGIKSTSDVASILSLGMKTAATLGVFSSAPSADPNTCTTAANEAMLLYREASAELKRITSEAELAEEIFRKSPTADNQRLVSRWDVALETAAADRRDIRDRSLRRQLDFRVRPTDPDCASKRGTPELCTFTAILAPSLSDFRNWITPESSSDGLAKLAINVSAQAPASLERDTPLPQRPLPGIFYRNPTDGNLSVTPIDPAWSLLAIDVGQMSFPQFGSRAFVEMSGGRVGGRSVSVSFDESGRLKTYESTTQGAFKELVQSASDAAPNFKKDEIEDLQRQIDLATKKRELIEARKKLENVLEQSND